MNRRGFLKAFGHVMLGSMAMGYSGYAYGTNVEPEWLMVEHVTVPLPDLPSALEGFKIVHLSDIHLHPHTTIETVRQAVDVANALQPDLAVLTGDYVLQGADSIFELAPALARLDARYGVFASLGNHDLWTNASVVRQGLEAEGIPVLCNNGVSLGVGRELLYLAGLDDAWSGRPDLDAALAQAPPKAPTILLAHEPDIADDVARQGRVALQLSGHSHGGQVRLPGIGAFILPYLGKKYDLGLNRVQEMWVYTTRGVGVIGPPIRINCPPEVTELTLVSA